MSRLPWGGQDNSGKSFLTSAVRQVIIVFIIVHLTWGWLAFYMCSGDWAQFVRLACSTPTCSLVSPVFHRALKRKQGKLCWMEREKYLCFHSQIFFPLSFESFIQCILIIFITHSSQIYSLPPLYPFPTSYLFYFILFLINKLICVIHILMAIH